MICDELDRNLILEFFNTLSEENKLAIASRMSSSELALFIAEKYLNWLDEKRSSTTDEYFRMGTNYVYVISLYRLFKKALRAGDAIMIEWLYQQFLGIFLITKKNHYVEML